MSNKKIKSPKQLVKIISKYKKKKRKIAFTNGCFDILHPGHISYLEEAKRKSDVLIVALNADSSVRRIKGQARPISKLRDRQRIVAALESVDYVTSFSETTPLRLISRLKPDLLIKGGDWKATDIVGRKVVAKYGGKAVSVKYKKGYSTSSIVKKIKKSSLRGGRGPTKQFQK